MSPRPPNPRPRLVLVAGLSLAAGARAQQPGYKLPLALASEAALDAVKACEASGFEVTAAVVDEAGAIKVLAKGDESTPHTRDSSVRKAYATVTMAPIFKFDTTGQFVERLESNPAAAAFASLPDILLLAGGVAIRVHGEVVAAIGVGGAPGGDFEILFLEIEPGAQPISERSLRNRVLGSLDWIEQRRAWAEQRGSRAPELN